MSLGEAEIPLLDIAAIAAAATKDLVAKRTRTPTEHTVAKSVTPAVNGRNNPKGQYQSNCFLLSFEESLRASGASANRAAKQNLRWQERIGAAR